jgi:hypothetical protein
MKRYRLVGSEFQEWPDGAWVLYVEAYYDLAATNTELEHQRAERVQLETLVGQLRDDLTACQLERDGLRTTIAKEINKRADWHHAQSSERYYTVPSAKGDECRYLAEKIKKGLTP